MTLVLRIGLCLGEGCYGRELFVRVGVGRDHVEHEDIAAVGTVVMMTRWFKADVDVVRLAKVVVVVVVVVVVIVCLLHWRCMSRGCSLCAGILQMWKNNEEESEKKGKKEKGSCISQVGRHSSLQSQAQNRFFFIIFSFVFFTVPPL